jgi:hypothetical protein
MIRLVLFVAYALVLFFLVPIAAIWSVNTLFATTIPVTLETWAAALILGSVVGGTNAVSFKTKV